MKSVFLFLLIVFAGSNAYAVGEFITRWNLGIPGSGATQLSFDVETVGTVNYFWNEVSPGTASGSGTFSGSTATITSLPTGAVIDLSIGSTNFRRLIINDGIEKNRLTDVRQWGTTSWTSMRNAFFGCTNLQISATDLPNLSGLSDIAGMFGECTVLNGPANIGQWNTSNVTNMVGVFYFASSFNQPIGNWNTAKVTAMISMFNNASAFNRPIGTWNVSNVTEIREMFLLATSFNQPIGAWNLAKVTDIKNMFFRASSFNQPIGNWNTTGFTNMESMFDGATAFNQPIGSWNTANVRDMRAMFHGATAFNQPIGNWNTARVTSMGGMFGYATSFNQSIGTWALNSVGILTTMLDNSGMDCAHYSETLMGWASNPATPNGLSLGAIGRSYGTNAVFARTILTSVIRWVITGDAASGTDCTPLPVRLVSFTGKVQDGTVSLDWQTADEQNNFGFDIEKSSDAKTFEKIGFVDGTGDSRQVKKYHFTDANPLQTNYYRLKQIDSDGTSEYSRIISVKGDAVAFTIYPNPAQNRIYLKNVEGSAEVSISTMNGELLMKKTIHALEPIDVNSIPAGLFMVRIGKSNKKLAIHR